MPDFSRKGAGFRVPFGVIMCLLGGGLLGFGAFRVLGFLDSVGFKLIC